MRVLVAAPHPDDETLGCGGTLLRHRADGDEIFWLIVTEPGPALGLNVEAITRRDREIDAVSAHYGFTKTFQLGFPAIELDTIASNQIIMRCGEIVKQIEPDWIYLPFRGDAHSDHKIVFDAMAACTKWFRYPSIKRVLAYETPSETDMALPLGPGFQPQAFVDIAGFLEKKVAAMNMYPSEMGKFPFPRCEQVIRALATLRGSQSGYKAAEAFMILKDHR